MRVVIAGGSGFIGGALCRRLTENGYDVAVLSRTPERRREALPEKVETIEWDGRTLQGWARRVEGAYGIVHLAGEDIASGFWTKAKKQRIRDSRIEPGKALVGAIAQAAVKPKVLVQASAAGYYGPCPEGIVEETSPAGVGFLAQVTQEWEGSTAPVEAMGVRRVIIRTGLALGAEGGVLRRMRLPFRLFHGGHLGSGDQWWPWIHIEDEVRAIHFLMEREDLSGAFNLAAPEPMVMRFFCRKLGHVMRRPSWFPAPRFALRMFLGEMADEMLLAGQRAAPRRLLDAGFEFLYPTLEPALRNILGKEDGT